MRPPGDRPSPFGRSVFGAKQRLIAAFRGPVACVENPCAAASKTSHGIHMGNFHLKWPVAWSSGGHRVHLRVGRFLNVSAAKSIKTGAFSGEEPPPFLLHVTSGHLREKIPAKISVNSFKFENETPCNLPFRSQHVKKQEMM